MDIAAAFVFAVLAVLLAEIPRRLFNQAGGGTASTRYDAWLGFVLFVVGFAVFKSGVGGYLAEHFVFALSCEVLAAAVYASVRFGVIPDLYSGLLVVLALDHAYNTGDWLGAGVGALVCGGLLAAMAFAFERLRGIEGMGLADVKLAFALGGLLGPSWGVRAIAVAAIGAALAAGALLLLRRRKLMPDEGPLRAPFGAALALASAGAFIWSAM